MIHTKIILKRLIDRMRNISLNSYNSDLKYIIGQIDGDLVLSTAIHQTVANREFLSFKDVHKFVSDRHRGREIYDSDEEMGSAIYQFIKLGSIETNYELLNTRLLLSSKRIEGLRDLRDHLLLPLLRYLNEQVEDVNVNLYLLERYKHKVEWFDHKTILSEYVNLKKEYESYLEFNLRKYLFESGIDFPFSSPQSPSGKGDIIAEINSKSPLISEVKVIDSTKKYGKGRIKSGVNQLVGYTNDYRKREGYLVVFNMDDTEINITAHGRTENHTPILKVEDKIYYIVVVDCNRSSSVSTLKKKKTIEIKLSDLMGD